uniref:Uncharacterized protein n=1 Tax=Ananas comosus var. bracteatus TaxID=296719 RepID=A0A6V7PZB9_ANACO|nr:unnamed protein product [Ananas comosus var. bracteatus]
MGVYDYPNSPFPPRPHQDTNASPPPPPPLLPPPPPRSCPLLLRHFRGLPPSRARPRRRLRAPQGAAPRLAPSSYLRWVASTLRARDSEPWARLADQVLADPVYRDRLEWEHAARLLSGDALGASSFSPSGPAAASSPSSATSPSASGGTTTTGRGGRASISSSSAPPSGGGSPEPEGDWAEQKVGFWRRRRRRRGWLCRW